MLSNTFLCFSRKQALAALSSGDVSSSFEDRFLLLLRSGCLSQAEAELLVCGQHSSSRSFLLLLRVAQGLTTELSFLLAEPVHSSSEECVVWFARQQWLLLKGDYQAVVELGLPTAQHCETSAWHRLSLAIALVWLGQLSEAVAQQQHLSPEFVPTERIEFEARLALLRKQPEASLALLSPLLDEGNASPLGWELAIHVLAQLGDTSPAKTMLNRARILFPNSARLLGRAVVGCVLNRQPILGRRLALLERLLAVDEKNLQQRDRLRRQQNLAHLYENGGRADLLCSLHQSMLDENQAWEFAGNHALQMASLASPRTKEALLSAQKLLPRHHGSTALVSSRRSRQSTRKLRIGFITPDVNYHPVSRFLLMQMAHRPENNFDLHLVRTAGNDDWASDVVKNYASSAGCWNDLRAKSFQQQLSEIRDLKLDVAIDLAGWTGNSSPGLFASRVAPVQVNYLGFFASTGLPEMDYWLGDSALFPEPMREWSSEQIWRLPRCFLAWQPIEQLPEGRVAVPAGPAATDLVFGSFNHVRKLSDATLRLWGRILQAVSGSRLALKAYTSDDPGTTTLLRRRMLRCGLDPERVIWLPTCASPEDHLRQYGLVDVALDPFPNGGCTTSCEALWMGVPVITLAGDRYVSRMSTAVLSGAELPEWIASSEEDYFNKALQAASQRQHLRDSREQLRLHLQVSPLGDAAGLNASLAQAWQGMVEQKSQAESSVPR